MGSSVARGLCLGRQHWRRPALRAAVRLCQGRPSAANGQINLPSAAHSCRQRVALEPGPGPRCLGNGGAIAPVGRALACNARQYGTCLIVSASPELVAAPTLPAKQAASCPFRDLTQKIFYRSRHHTPRKLDLDDSFYRWLVGFTDGDGCFSIIKQGSGNLSLNFSITQSTCNEQILYRIKKRLKVGVVSVYKDRAVYAIRDRSLFSQVIFPIFDKFPLLTSKQFYYEKLKKAYNILEDHNLSPAQKNHLCDQLRQQKPPEYYLSPVWRGMAWSDPSKAGHRLGSGRPATLAKPPKRWLAEQREARAKPQAAQEALDNTGPAPGERGQYLACSVPQPNRNW